MCNECGCGPRGFHYGGHYQPLMNFPPLMSIEEEVKMLEEMKDALANRLDKVNKRLESLKTLKPVEKVQK